MEIRKHNSGRFSIEDIQNFVRFWNTTYPIDYWWRQKHKIAFGSAAHMDQSILDMRIEFEEDRLLQEERLASIKKKRYIKGRGDWLNKKKYTREVRDDQIDDLFDSIDITTLQESDRAKKEAGETDNDITLKKKK